MTNYAKLPFNKNSLENYNCPNSKVEFIKEIICKKMLTKRMGFFAYAIIEESSIIANEMFGSISVSLKGQNYSDEVLRQRELQENNIETQKCKPYYDLEEMMKFDSTPHDADWNDLSSQFKCRRDLMVKNCSERVLILDEFIKRMKAKYRKRVAHFTDNQFARYIDGTEGDLE